VEKKIVAGPNYIRREQTLESRKKECFAAGKKARLPTKEKTFLTELRIVSDPKTEEKKAGNRAQRKGRAVEVLAQDKAKGKKHVALARPRGKKPPRHLNGVPRDSWAHFSNLNAQGKEAQARCIKERSSSDFLSLLSGVFCLFLKR